MRLGQVLAGDRRHPAVAERRRNCAGFRCEELSDQLGVEAVPQDCAGNGAPLEAPFGPPVGQRKSQVVSAVGQARVDDVLHVAVFGGGDDVLVPGDDDVVLCRAGGDDNQRVHITKGQRGGVVKVEPAQVRIVPRLAGSANRIGSYLCQVVKDCLGEVA